MRSPREISFRLRQEIGNLWLLARQPGFTGTAQGAPIGLPPAGPVADRLRDTPYAATVAQLAERILRHDFPLMGVAISTGPEIRWRRDYVHNVETGTAYFRRIPYLDASCAGDHKIIWELNRHQHLVLLAQAHLLTGRREFIGEIQAQLESWMAANPFQRGINWASALEVAFRALSWIWIDHLAGAFMDAPFRARFRTVLYRHGLHIARNLSIYFSRNTHLLGEAVALHALGVLYPGFPSAAQWRETGARIVREELVFQVWSDGAHFEQSTWYHVYALDLFLFHAVLAEVPPAYRESLCRMADYLAALLGNSGAMPRLGDDDGGRLFHPYGPGERIGRPTLATASLLLDGDWPHAAADRYEQAAWWLGERALQPPDARPAETSQSRHFAASGLTVMASGEFRVYADAGPMGYGSGGHSHSDALSVTARLGDEDLLIDPGAYTYVADPLWRDRFRGSAAHNTVRIDGRDQAVPAGPFRWRDMPEATVAEWRTAPDRDRLDALCRYAGFTHRRRFLLLKPGVLIMLDDIDGPPGPHRLEWFWHAGQPVSVLTPDCFAIGRNAQLVVDRSLPASLTEGGEFGWRSPVFGCKVEAPVIYAVVETELPFRTATLLRLAGAATSPARLWIEGDAVRIDDRTLTDWLRL